MLNPLEMTRVGAVVKKATAEFGLHSVDVTFHEYVRGAAMLKCSLTPERSSVAVVTRRMINHMTDDEIVRVMRDQLTPLLGKKR